MKPSSIATTSEDARQIAANIAKLPELVRCSRQPWRRELGAVIAHDKDLI